MTRSVATILGTLGGLAILVGGLLQFVLRWSVSAGSPSAGALVSGLLALLLAGVLGFFVLISCRPRLWWWPGRRLFNAVWLIVLGAVAWILLGGSLLTNVGALLTIVAGVVLPFEHLVGRGLGIQGGWLRRRRF